MRRIESSGKGDDATPTAHAPFDPWGGLQPASFAKHFVSAKPHFQARLAARIHLDVRFPKVPIPDLPATMARRGFRQ